MGLTFKEFCKKEKKQYLLDEWDDEKNLPFTPDTVSASSSVPVWWKCKNGHSWQTQLGSRSKTLTRCPKCLEEKLAKKRELQVKQFAMNLKTPQMKTACIITPFLYHRMFVITLSMI